ncbi:MAG: aldo/keto reductase [Bulleidia sp.]
MKYRTLGNTDLNASVIALGTWGLGGGSVWEDTDLNSADSLLSAAADCGINYIDTAPVYGMGRSEELLGRALSGRRDKFLLQTKCSLNWRLNDGIFKYARDGYTVNNNTGRDAIRRDVEESLQRMHTDYIDVLAVHYVSSSWPAEETVSGLEDLVREGKIRAYGISNSQPHDLEAYAAYGNPALVQEQYSLLAPSHGESYFPACTKHHVTFQVYGALEEGYLTGPDHLYRTYQPGDIRARLPWNTEPYQSNLKKLYDEVWTPLAEKYHCSYANLFEAWTLKQYDNLSLLIGCRHPETILNTARCLDLSLEPEDVKLLSETAKSVQVEELDK